MKQQKTISKAISDPIYGLLRINNPLLLSIIDDPCFQRLRRISQLGLASFVYPGATHTRFQHSLGALYLMKKSLTELKQKGHKITEKEQQAAEIAILLHDVGHGPFSHSLEKQFVNHNHENISLAYLKKLNEKFDGQLNLASQIYQGKYHRSFFNQLIRSQIDVDRLDYLARDSFYTGVVEGKVGYDRILNMINVKDNKLVIEERGGHSIENFLSARHFMHLQVYQHKTAVVAEQMLLRIIQKAKQLFVENPKNHGIPLSPITELWSSTKTQTNLALEKKLCLFSELDDMDVWQLIKAGSKHSNDLFALLCSKVLNRQLFKIEEHTRPIGEKKKQTIKKRIAWQYNIKKEEDLNRFLFTHKSSVAVCKSQEEPILILKKDGSLRKVNEWMDSMLENRKPNAFTKYYFCYTD